VSGPADNRDQIAYWSQRAGPKWVRLQERIDRQMEEIGRGLLERARLRPGERVLDVGCGCGASTLEAARRVAPAGRVVGVDVSAVMLERAEERAREARVANVRFEEADAQVHRFEPESVDAIVSRFGVMFFSDARAAFSNLRAALRPGGRLCFVCWQPLVRNPWMAVPLRAAAAELEDLPPPPPAGAPGPFALGEEGLVAALLEEAGFSKIAVEGLEVPVRLGGEGGLEETVEFALQLGPAAALLAEAAPEVVERVRSAVREALAPHATPRGVELPSAAWLVLAG
jgi:SAM-dependent methyltransferase